MKIRRFRRLQCEASLWDRFFIFYLRNLRNLWIIYQGALMSLTAHHQR